MEKHALTRPSALKRARRVGRGGKRGKTAGRGHKGQKARAGNSTRPELRDIIKKLPKRRGYGKNRARTVVPHSPAAAVNLDALSTHFESGARVTPKSLHKAGLVRKVNGSLPQVKILARGELSKKLSFSNVSVSKAAEEAIAKAGGSIKTN